MIHEIIKSIAQGYADSHITMFQLKSFRYGEHRRSYKVGDQVLVENGKLINSQGEVPTHEITLLEGNAADTKHSMTLINLTTNEPLKIDL